MSRVLLLLPPGNIGTQQVAEDYLVVRTEHKNNSVPAREATPSSTTPRSFPSGGTIHDEHTNGLCKKISKEQMQQQNFQYQFSIFISHYLPKFNVIFFFTPADVHGCEVARARMKHREALEEAMPWISYSFSPLIFQTHDDFSMQNSIWKTKKKMKFTARAPRYEKYLGVRQHSLASIFDQKETKTFYYCSRGRSQHASGVSSSKLEIHTVLHKL